MSGNTKEALPQATESVPPMASKTTSASAGSSFPMVASSRPETSTGPSTSSTSAAISMRIERS
ncbi:Uncharacterised protein [Mycobacteroides abscessus subsp. massiliense]|nr:Uncharacterised protein [Mycobacteroides abscessus subsp. massiliense]